MFPCGLSQLYISHLNTGMSWVELDEFGSANVCTLFITNYKCGRTKNIKYVGCVFLGEQRTAVCSQPGDALCYRHNQESIQPMQERGTMSWRSEHPSGVTGQCEKVPACPGTQYSGAQFLDTTGATCQLGDRSQSSSPGSKWKYRRATGVGVTEQSARVKGEDSCHSCRTPS